MKIPLVSVAIISYNQENFIREAIESVILQDYPNVELCISDDASTDNTSKVILEYVDKLVTYPNIKIKYLLNQDNCGIVKNYNKVLNLCTGDYIAWLDGDDLFLAGKISAQVKFMQENPKCVISHTEVEAFDNSTNEIIFKSNDIKINRNGNARTLLRHGAIFNNCTTMVIGDWQRKIRFDENYRVLGDWLNKVELLLASGGLIQYLDINLSRYRVHGNNTSRRDGSKVIGQNVLDQINQHIKILNKYPQLQNDILRGLSQVYRSIGKYNDVIFYKIAFKICPFYWKNIIMYLKTFIS